MAEFDVLIVGGGPVGAATALALRGTGLRFGLIEARSAGAAGADPRPIALSHGSRLILERLGAWEGGLAATATPIERIHVSQRGGFGRVELSAAESGLPALGYVVDYGHLAAALTRPLEAGGGCRVIRAAVTGVEGGSEAARVRLDTEESSGPPAARLVVLAEGGALAAEQARTLEYGQSVVTTRVTSELAHRNVAYERFTPEGPLALLPSGPGMALVWTTAPRDAESLCELPEDAFLSRLQSAFGSRLGVFLSAGRRARYPVALKVAARPGEPRVVALGNAAQTLHPVAGQGLNLGLRDAWELAETLAAATPEDVGGEAHLRRYRARRRWDRRGGIGFTDGLVRLFSNDVPPLRFARGLGLAALGVLPAARKFVVRRMTFGARG